MSLRSKRSLRRDRQRDRERAKALGLPVPAAPLPYRAPHTAESLLRDLVAVVITYLYEVEPSTTGAVEAEHELRKTLDTCEVFLDPTLTAPPEARVDLTKAGSPRCGARH